ncbi:MAG: hypothetical protein WA864_31480 [Acetobacteraceae bacterium]
MLQIVGTIGRIGRDHVVKAESIKQIGRDLKVQQRDSEGAAIGEDVARESPDYRDVRRRIALPHWHRQIDSPMVIARGDTNLHSVR